jgi:chromosome partitioning protein
MSKIIAISNQKGGVGKTTTAVNLSACLGALEKRVLVVDMDPQGNASQGLGLNEIQEEDIFEVLSNATTPDSVTKEYLYSVIKDTDISWLKLLPASPGLAALEMELVNSQQREYRLRNALTAIRNDFDYILIDAPPSLGMLTINVLTAADSVIIPIQCEYYALQGLAELLNTITLVQGSFNNELRVEGALLTMYDSRLSLANSVVEEVRSDFEERVFKTIIPRNVKLGEAPSYGKPIILYAANCIGSEKYLDLAKEIIDNEKEVKNG